MHMASKSTSTERISIEPPTRRIQRRTLSLLLIELPYLMMMVVEEIWSSALKKKRSCSREETRLIRERGRWRGKFGFIFLRLHHCHHLLLFVYALLRGGLPWWEDQWSLEALGQGSDECRSCGKHRRSRRKPSLEKESRALCFSLSVCAKVLKPSQKPYIMKNFDGCENGASLLCFHFAFCFLLLRLLLPLWMRRCEGYNM